MTRIDHLPGSIRNIKRQNRGESMIGTPPTPQSGIKIPRRTQAAQRNLKGTGRKG